MRSGTVLLLLFLPQNFQTTLEAFTHHARSSLHFMSLSYNSHSRLWKAKKNALACGCAPRGASYVSIYGSMLSNSFRYCRSSRPFGPTTREIVFWGMLPFDQSVATSTLSQPWEKGLTLKSIQPLLVQGVPSCFRISCGVSGSKVKDRDGKAHVIQRDTSLRRIH